MKYVITHSSDNKGTVIDGDTLHRWIDTVMAAEDGDTDAAQILPGQSLYVAQRIADLIGYSPEASR